MNKLKEFFVWKDLKTQVRHRLPGRLRLHVPALKKLPDPLTAIGPALPGLLSIPNGVETANLDRRSGNVLIHYDQKIITEKEILDFYQALSQIIRRNLAFLQEAFNTDPAESLARLEWAIRNALHQKIKLDANIDLTETG